VKKKGDSSDRIVLSTKEKDRKDKRQLNKKMAQKEQKRADERGEKLYQGPE